MVVQTDDMHFNLQGDLGRPLHIRDGLGCYLHCVKVWQYGGSPHHPLRDPPSLRLLVAGTGGKLGVANLDKDLLVLPASSAALLEGKLEALLELATEHVPTSTSTSEKSKGLVAGSAECGAALSGVDKVPQTWSPIHGFTKFGHSQVCAYARKGDGVSESEVFVRTDVALPYSTEAVFEKLISPLVQKNVSPHVRDVRILKCFSPYSYTAHVQFQKPSGQRNKRQTTTTDPDGSVRTDYSDSDAVLFTHWRTLADGRTLVCAYSCEDYHQHGEEAVPVNKETMRQRVLLAGYVGRQMHA